MLHKSRWLLCVAAGGFLAGSIAVGSLTSASAGPAVSGTVVANQGTPGTSAWPVSASQTGAWNVGVAGALPAGTNTIGKVGVTGALPAGTNTIGSVGVTGALPAGTNTIGSVGVTGALPAGTNTIGSVNVANFPTSEQVTGVTSVLPNGAGSETLPAAASFGTNAIDTTGDRTVKLYLLCIPENTGDCANVTVDVTTDIPGLAEFQLDAFTLGDEQTTAKSYDVPGTNVDISVRNNNPSDAVTFDFAVEGRTN
jgi:hypothetical protein